MKETLKRRVINRMRLNRERYDAICEATELLNKWRDYNDERYRQEAIKVIQECN